MGGLREGEEERGEGVVAAAVVAYWSSGRSALMLLAVLCLWYFDVWLENLLLHVVAMLKLSQE